MKYPPTKNINENNSSNNSQNPTEKKELKEEERNNKIPTILVPTPIFYNPMMKNTKNMYGKYPKKKTRPFTERQGDWICKFCKNLNFAFRNECNRCKVPKKVCVESVKQNEENETKKEEKINKEEKDNDNNEEKPDKENPEENKEEEEEEEKEKENESLTCEEILSKIIDKIEELDNVIEKYKKDIEECKIEVENKIKSKNKEGVKRVLAKKKKYEERIKDIELAKGLLEEQKIKLNKVLSEKEKLKELNKENNEIKNDINTNQEKENTNDDITQEEVKENNQNENIKNEDDEVKNEKKLIKQINKLYQSVPLPEYNFDDDEQEMEEEV